VYLNILQLLARHASCESFGREMFPRRCDIVCDSFAGILLWKIFYSGCNFFETKPYIYCSRSWQWIIFRDPIPTWPINRLTFDPRDPWPYTWFHLSTEFKTLTSVLVTREMRRNTSAVSVTSADLLRLNNLELCIISSYMTTQYKQQQ